LAFPTKAGPRRKFARARARARVCTCKGPIWRWSDNRCCMSHRYIPGTVLPSTLLRSALRKVNNSTWKMKNYLSRRSLLFYTFSKRAMKLTVVIIVKYYTIISQGYVCK
jgi:hypothetical protein